MIPQLEVFDHSADHDVHVGTAFFSFRRGAISTSFQYSEEWLDDLDHAYAIDPALPLSPGFQHCSGLPGAFRDSAPDRWGRTLIDHEQRDASIKSGEPLRRLDEIDYLISVFDSTREGSLRYRIGEEDFLSSGRTIPPMIELPTLLDLSREVVDRTAGFEQIKVLLEAGSASLGGARPKASVSDGKKLLLAKFPHKHDDWNMMAWEKTMLDMAGALGIEVPHSKLVRIGDESVLLLERFDRQNSEMDGRRVPYLSGMTILGAKDGENRDYAELAENLVFWTSSARSQLLELYKRIVFYVAVGNTDDHLRNWGIIRKNDEWVLSPSFDINPNPYENANRTTRILGALDDKDANLQEFGEYIGIEAEQRSSIIHKTLGITKRLRWFAQKNGCSASEIALFEREIDRRSTLLRACIST